jgi:archaeosortase B (VPXXXP-CTERM-specific)
MSVRSLAANPAYRFVGLFAIYLGLIAVGYPWLTKRAISVVEALTTATAVIGTGILSLVTQEATRSGSLMQLGTFGVLIIEECTGVFEMLIFMAAVLAYPTGWRDKLLGFALGIPLLYLFNLARIIVLLWVGRFHNELFEFMHIYFWQATLILMITSVWLLWILKVVRRVERPAATGA